MVLKILLLAAAVAVYAEPPGIQRRAPYAAAGWRPRVPFNLPGEYLPPSSGPAEPQRLRPNVEISKERVEQVGTLNAPQNNYLPPLLNVPGEQALPSPNEAELFNKESAIQRTPAPQQPASQYGPPADRGFSIVYPDDEAPPTADARLQSTTQGSRVKEGRYYIVSPDNKLQRVVYRTSQSVEDATGDGFTAQLQYSTIGELQDPVYRYNNEGQLVRVLK